MAAGHQINIKDLIKISKELRPSFFISSDLYSLLVLAMVTVTEYSRRKHRLNTQTRIELATDFLPDLIDALTIDKIIPKEIADYLTQECISRKSEIPIILRSFVYVSGGLRTTMPSKKMNNYKCIIM